MEILCSCPIENVKEAVPIMYDCMIKSGSDIRAQLRCDVSISTSWYGEEYRINEEGKLISIDRQREIDYYEYDEEDEDDEQEN